MRRADRHAPAPVRICAPIWLWRAVSGAGRRRGARGFSRSPSRFSPVAWSPSVAELAFGDRTDWAGIVADDGQMLLVDRFDVVFHAHDRVERLGFEDIAALAGLRVRDVLSDRKYQGSYQRIAELLRQLQMHGDNLHRFFRQVAFSVMVRNGDAHLKNFGVLYRSAADLWLAPMFDVVTTAIYPYARSPGGPLLEDRTMALKLFAGRHGSRAYPTTAELCDFGRRICGVWQPARVLESIADAMSLTLREAQGDDRVPAGLLAKMARAWGDGMRHASNRSPEPGP